MKRDINLKVISYINDNNQIRQVFFWLI
jgi:hypothetical protein